MTIVCNLFFEAEDGMPISCGAGVVTCGLVLLFGIGTGAFPSWDSRTRRNNLLVGLAVEERRVLVAIPNHLIHRPAHEIFFPLFFALLFSHLVPAAAVDVSSVLHNTVAST